MYNTLDGISVLSVTGGPRPVCLNFIYRAIYSLLTDYLAVNWSLIEAITRQVVDIFNKYLYNPKRTEDLNLSPWYVILTHLQQLIESKLWFTKTSIFWEIFYFSECRKMSFLGLRKTQSFYSNLWNRIKPVFVIPLMQLLNRLLPCRSDDPYLSLWRLILLHEQIGDQAWGRQYSISQIFRGLAIFKNEYSRQTN